MDQKGLQKEEDKITAFCNHPKWSKVLQEITTCVGKYQHLYNKMQTEITDKAFPLEAGRFRLEYSTGAAVSPGAIFVPSIGMGSYGKDAYRLFTGKELIYDFRYRSEAVEDEAVEEEAGPAIQKKSFYGTYADQRPAKPLSFRVITQVKAVAWGKVFGLEEFLREIKTILKDLEARVKEQAAERQEEETQFDEFLEGASELLEGDEE